ncbi:MAG: nuclear transport factor 2 family protein [Sediminibacterium sp.]|nr:nuclear transport factor 2 family protein [Sediminibacterium sp.]
MIKNILCLCMLLFAQFANAQTKDANKILQIMSAQEKAWNEGDIEQFMKGYWENDSLVFVGKSGLTYGYNNTLANYKKGYPDKTYMGKLKFTILSMQPLGKQFYRVIGKWELTRTVGNLSGHYTLLLQKINGEWKIISDHSS